MPANVAGKKFTFPSNDRKLESLALESGNDGGATLVTRVDGVERRLAYGRGAWRPGRAAWGLVPEQPEAVDGAWTVDGTFTAKVCFTETPFVVTIRFTFAGQEVRCESESNVRFGSGKDAPLVGKAG